ncbi:MAG: amylo-alpha-1,6-glucosidase [Ktedonobacteraceae bacterium]
MDMIKANMLPHENLALESEVLHKLWRNGLLDLQSLQTPLGITASGQNDQFHAIFGRDSLWTVLLALEAGRLQQQSARQDAAAPLASYASWLHELSTSVLRGLTGLQGKVVNDVNEEQPGRIVHEYWDPVPQRMIAARWPVADGHGRYYATFDATFLYLITIARVVEFFDDQALLEELWPGIEAAFHWMLDWSDLDQDGLVEYKKRNPEGIGLDNQVWKDSGESIRSNDHQPVIHPVAWVEVQGYAWAAYAAYRDLAKKHGNLDASLEQEIQHRMMGLQAGLQRFWLDEEHFPAMALDGEKKPVPIVSSNPGHLLWSGCPNQTEAERICQRLMMPDMLTPWGLRTLSQHAYFYNPTAYHCGAVWPFDNAVIASGLLRYGYQAEAHDISQRVLQAILAFDNPVELYTVQPSRWIRSHHIEQEWFLADYLYACDVQAWTAAAILFMTSMLLYQ